MKLPRDTQRKHLAMKRIHDPDFRKAQFALHQLTKCPLLDIEPGFAVDEESWSYFYFLKYSISWARRWNLHVMRDLK